MYEKNSDNLDYSANIHSSLLLEGRVDFPALLTLGDLLGLWDTSRTDTHKGLKSTRWVRLAVLSLCHSNEKRLPRQLLSLQPEPRDEHAWSNLNSTLGEEESPLDPLLEAMGAEPSSAQLPTNPALRHMSENKDCRFKLLSWG